LNAAPTSAAENRLLITFDKDFGELVFWRGAQASRGIVLFRNSQPSSAAVAERWPRGMIGPAFQRDGRFYDS
jgi:hypothetical protein